MNTQLERIIQLASNMVRWSKTIQDGQAITSAAGELLQSARLGEPALYLRLLFCNLEYVLSERRNTKRKREFVARIILEKVRLPLTMKPWRDVKEGDRFVWRNLNARRHTILTVETATRKGEYIEVKPRHSCFTLEFHAASLAIVEEPEVNSDALAA